MSELKNVVNLYIKQICDKLDQKDFNFYKEIKNMDTIRFSNEF